MDKMHLLPIYMSDHLFSQYTYNICIYIPAFINKKRMSETVKQTAQE